MSAFLYRLGRACYRFRGRVLAAWLLLAVVLGAVTLGAVSTGAKFSDNFTIPGSSSQTALEQLNVTFPEASDASASLVVGAPEGTRIDDADAKRAVEQYLKDLDELPFVKGTQSPYNEYVKGLVTEDGSHALIRVRVEGTASTFTDAQRAELSEAAQGITELLPGSRVDVGGDVYAMHLPHLSVTEALGVVVAVVVLVATLGGFLAAVMPLGTAITGVALGVMLTTVGSSVIDVSSTALMLVIMLCLAVGIDYALFIISRHRDQLAHGMDVEESAARAVATSGSAVVFAGATVIIALVGLSIAALPFLTVMGVFTAVGVALEVLLALTLLPAFLGFAGERLRPRRRRTQADTSAVNQPAKRNSAAGWWVRTVTRWPLLTVAIVLVGMGALALPAQDMRLSLPNSGQAAPGEPDRIAYDLITKEFGVGFNGPLVITGSIVESDDPVEILDGMRDDIETIPGVKMVAAAVPNSNADTAMIQVIPTTGPDDPKTATLVEALRERHDDWQQRFGVDTSVTGLTAAQIDVTARLGQALVPFGIFVVGLSLVLLMMAFRSVWVPVKAALGYLLSIGAAFGATTLVFNEGVGAWIINLPEPGPIISFLPIILMGILFGLAMDYEVFLTSRMREEYIHGNTEHWVQDGFIHSAKVVVAAALIMFSVFAFFVPSGIGVIKPIAFSLALGVALDAFVVRMTLGPALMKLMGGRVAWWLPTWLDRLLPSLDVEGEALAHQTRLADWPSTGNEAAIYAENVAGTAGEQVLFHDLTVELGRGETLVVEGEHVARLALMYALSGRVEFSAGEAKVLGRVLPEEASLVRVKAPVLIAESPDFADELTRARGGLVFVPAADELPAVDDAALAAARASDDPDEPTTWVLGIMPGTDPASVAPGTHKTLHLTSHLAEPAGATR